MLAAGTYRSHLEPTFAFTVGEGWERRVPDEEASDRYLMLLWTMAGGGELVYVELSELGAAGSLERFTRAALSEKTDPEPAAVGGVSGLRMEAGRPAVPTVILGVVGEYVLNPTDVARVTAVEVGGVTVTFIIEANVDDADVFRPIADKVLQSVVFD